MDRRFIKRFSLLLTLALCLLLLTACGGSKTESASPTAAPATEAPAPEVTEAPVPEVTEAPAPEVTEAPAEEPEETVPEEIVVVDGKLPDGVYDVKFSTDSSMFHVAEANNGRGVLTVKNGEMTIHISLGSKKIVNLFFGKAEDAKKEGAAIIEPTLDTVTYSDGMSEEVFGFDVPVPALDEEFDCALIGTKGVWYDHKVMVSDPQPMK